MKDGVALNALADAEGDRRADKGASKADEARKRMESGAPMAAGAAPALRLANGQPGDAQFGRGLAEELGKRPNLGISGNAATAGKSLRGYQARYTPVRHLAQAFATAAARPAVYRRVGIERAIPSRTARAALSKWSCDCGTTRLGRPLAIAKPVAPIPPI